jgi:hypothetical protein
VYCQSESVVKNGKTQACGQILQRYLCNERSSTPMARLRTPASEISLAINMRSEGFRSCDESQASEVHANHNEAQNSALRRHASAYRRRQNPIQGGLPLL